MLYLNCRSLKIFLAAFYYQLMFSVPVITLTETWTTCDTENCFNIPGYNFVYRSRGSGIGGGVACDGDAVYTAFCLLMILVFMLEMT